jgi:hypothetical protein
MRFSIALGLAARSRATVIVQQDLRRLCVLLPWGGATHRPPQTSPIRDFEGLVIAVRLRTSILRGIGLASRERARPVGRLHIHIARIFQPAKNLIGFVRRLV